MECMGYAKEYHMERLNSAQRQTLLDQLRTELAVIPVFRRLWLPTPSCLALRQAAVEFLTLYRSMSVEKDFYLTFGTQPGDQNFHCILQRELFQIGPDSVCDLANGSRFAATTIFKSYDVVTKLGLYDLRQFAWLQRKGSLLKGRHHLARSEITEIAATGGTRPL